MAYLMETGFGREAFAEAADTGLRVVVEGDAELASSTVGRVDLESPPPEDSLNARPSNPRSPCLPSNSPHSLASLRLLSTPIVPISSPASSA